MRLLGHWIEVRVVQLQEDPLRPLHIVGVRGIDLPVPVPDKGLHMGYKLERLWHENLKKKR